MDVKVFKDKVFGFVSQNVMVLHDDDETGHVHIRTLEGDTTSDTDGIVILSKKTALEVAKYILSVAEMEAKD